MLQVAKWKSIALLSATVTAFLPAARLIAQCSGDATVAAARLGIVNANGVRVIHIGFVQDFPPNVRTAVQHALDSWNAKTGTTKVSFTTDGTPDIKFNMAGQVNKCADYRSGNGATHFIDVSDYVTTALTPNGQAVTEAQAEARIDKARYPFAHELGHAMNLGESGDGDSIMSVPDYVQCNGAALDSFPAKDVSSGDATNAKNCLGQVIRDDVVFPSDGSLDHPETRYDCECSCWTQYEVIVGFRYSDQFDGYETDELFRFELDHGCGPPPI